LLLLRDMATLVPAILSAAAAAFFFFAALRRSSSSFTSTSLSGTL
jgi:hypothetical protein